MENTLPVRIPGKMGSLTNRDIRQNDHQFPLRKPGNHENTAALKLQKVYKSFRTRRRLADCAVIVEQRWWKLLDFAELNGCSVSFFDIEKPETAISRWSRARTRAAKLGKGLSKDEKATKLALQHWLEAIDPRHRYGHNLQFYYLKWVHCESKQPFFYWLDVGDGKEYVSERCPRLKLHQQCIKYLGPTERLAYEVEVEKGNFIYKQSRETLHTTGRPKETKWIFVLSTSKTFYVAQKIKGTFQHSSFLAGGATLSAGRLIVEHGILKAVWPHSGHYLPTEENFQAFMYFLQELDVDLTNVKKNPSEDDLEVVDKMSNNVYSPADSSVDSKTTLVMRISSKENPSSITKESNTTELSELPPLAKLKIPKRRNSFEICQTEPKASTVPSHIPIPDSLSEDGYETAEESLFMPKMNLSDEEEEEEEDEDGHPITEETLLERIVSHERKKSAQLSSTWSTGAGPRIGCMRDYPSKLQFRVLEQANLSPRKSRAHGIHSRTLSRLGPSPSPTSSICREASASSSPIERELLIGRWLQDAAEFSPAMAAARVVDAKKLSNGG